MQILPITCQINSFNRAKSLKTMALTSDAYECKIEQQKISPNMMRANLGINFTSFKATSEQSEYKHLGTAFYRDLYTLINAVAIIQNTFPEGCDILDFAASNGEEAISIYSLLDDNANQKYKIHSYDTSEKALKLAGKNIHSIFSSGTSDNFLIEESPQNAMYRNLSDRFYSIMEEVPPPDVEFNDADYLKRKREDKNFQIKYFRVKDEYLEKFTVKKGDIRNIQEIVPEKQVGAIFFRNAFYHLTNNHIFEGVHDRQTLDKIWNTNKSEVIEDVVSKVYDNLKPGGIFVIGEDEKEHIYQFDKYTPREEYYYDDVTDEYIRIKSPLRKALEKDNRFKPIVCSRCYSSMGDFEIYTVWQKVENSENSES